MKILRQKAGFTLLEAVLSIAVMAVLLLAFTMMISVSSRFAETASQRSDDLDETLLALRGASGSAVMEEQSDVLVIQGQNVPIQIHTYRSGDVSISSIEGGTE